MSFPSSVVRSIIRIARSSAQSFEAFLIERFFRRRPAPRRRPGRRRDPAEQAAERAGRPSHERTSSCARSRASGVGTVCGRHGTANVHPALCQRPPRTFGTGGNARRPLIRNHANQSRTCTRFSTRRNGVPDRVSSCVSSGTRIRRTGGRSYRSAVTEAAKHRAVIEQAKGMPMLTYQIDADSAFGLLGPAQSTTNTEVHDLAAHLVGHASTLCLETAPAQIDALLQQPR